MFVDSHCHLDRLSYGKQTNMADVARPPSRTWIFSVRERHPGAVPDHAGSDRPLSSSVCLLWCTNQEPGVDAALLLTQAADERVVAIGETGLDYFYSPENKEVQQASFREHIRVARALNKPLIIHTRDAQQDTLQIMREGAEQVGGCCTASPSRSRWRRRPWRWVLYLHLRYRYLQKMRLLCRRWSNAAAGATAG